MGYKLKVIIFTILACTSAASTAPIAAIPSIRPVFIVLPLILMGVFLFFSGYYAGLNRDKKSI